MFNGASSARRGGRSSDVKTGLTVFFFQSLPEKLRPQPHSAFNKYDTAAGAEDSAPQKKLKYIRAETLQTLKSTFMRIFCEQTVRREGKGGHERVSGVTDCEGFLSDAQQQREALGSGTEQPPTVGLLPHKEISCFKCEELSLIIRHRSQQHASLFLNSLTLELN